MIVICPTCHNRYYIQSEAIGESKLVRCAVCGAVWNQSAQNSFSEKKYNVLRTIKWVLFWFVVFMSLFSLFFAKEALIKIWPPIIEVYNVVGASSENNRKKAIIVQNISNFFVQKDGKLYMGLRGELINISDKVQILPSIKFSLKDDEHVLADGKVSYKKTWTHNLIYTRLLPNQKVTFETDLQNVPYNNLVCDVKLDLL